MLKFRDSTGMSVQSLRREQSELPSKNHFSAGFKFLHQRVYSRKRFAKGQLAVATAEMQELFLLLVERYVTMQKICTFEPVSEYDCCVYRRLF